MTLVQIALRYLRARWFPNLLTAACVSLGVGLLVAVIVVARGVKEGLLLGTSPYEMIVGAKGSPTQVVLSTVFFLDVPTGNIPFHVFRQLKQHPRVTLLVPVNLGDSYKGFRIVGTTPDYFTPVFQLGRREHRLRVAQGRFFAKDFEAVIGTTAARETVLAVGDQFLGIHGLEEGIGEEPDPAHRRQYTVVGILAPSSTAADRAIFTTMGSVWAVHGLPTAPLQELLSRGEGPPITALFLRAQSLMDLMLLATQLNGGPDAQAVFPGRIMERLFSMFDIGETIVEAIALMVLIVAATTISLSVFGATIERRRELATLRALGASPGTLVQLLLWESAMISLLGTVAGFGLGRGAAYVASRIIEISSGIYVPVWHFSLLEPLILGAMAVLGILAGLIPGLTAYRMEIADHLVSLA
ncbi:MAG: ABC transporter permease [Candidatus Methylomirabilales bacterium]|nr:ABC transporter permease [candidate division NC10 bacterium]